MNYYLIANTIKKLNGMSKKLIQLFGLFLFTILLLSTCKNASESKEMKVDLSTQENYEKFLADWEISIPEDAVLKEVKKTNDGNYKIIYNLEYFENMQDSLQMKYESMFDESLLVKGWTKPKKGWDPHGTLYEKEKEYFKFFITVSEKHEIYELAFKFGQ